MNYKVLFLLTLVSYFALSSSGLASPLMTISGGVSESHYEKPSDPGSIGTIGVDSSSFFYKSTARGTSATTLQATLKGKSESLWFRSQGDLLANTFVTDKPEFGIEAHEIYLETQKGALGNFQFTVGRKLYEWSKLDHTWTMMSLWSPRWTWDELHPELIGMTGAFLNYEDKNFQFLIFGSPLAIPERGTPVSEEDHNIVSPNPFWKPLPRSIQVMNQNTPASYTLITPAMQDILFRPNFAVRARYKTDAGAWASVNSGVLPVNMVQMAAEPFLAPGAGTDLQVYIRPQFPMRNINTAEIGYDAPDKSWELWLSGTYEQPFKFENQANWLNPIITPSTVISTGSSVKLTSNFRFESGLIFIHEDPFTRASDLPNVNVQLPTRFPLKQGIKLGGKWNFNENSVTNFTWIQDLLNQNHFASADYEHTFRSEGFTVGAGFDVLIADTNQGWVGQYYGNDRLRGWFKYAF